MPLDEKQAMRLFFLTGLPEAYTYARAARRRGQEQGKPRQK